MAICSMVMCYYTYYALGLNVDNRYVAFVFFATLLSYNFHWYLTADGPSVSKRVHWTLRNKLTHAILSILALAGALITGYALKDHWLWLGVIAFLTFLYSAPKIPVWPFNQLYRIAVGKTIFLALVWLHVTVIMPVAFSGSGYPAQFELFAVNRFFLIFPICILFDYRDQEHDIQAGIRSMINLLSGKGIDVVCWFSLAVFLLTSLYFGYHHPFLQSIFLITPGFLLALIYSTAKRHKTDFLYYFILDGLMMLSGILAVVFEFWLHLRA